MSFPIEYYMRPVPYERRGIHWMTQSTHTHIILWPSPSVGFKEATAPCELHLWCERRICSIYLVVITTITKLKCVCVLLLFLFCCSTFSAIFVIFMFGETHISPLLRSPPIIHIIRMISIGISTNSDIKVQFLYFSSGRKGGWVLFFGESRAGGQASVASFESSKLSQ